MKGALDTPASAGCLPGIGPARQPVTSGEATISG
jgi:hypothetical protein